MILREIVEAIAGRDAAEEHHDDSPPRSAGDRHIPGPSEIYWGRTSRFSRRPRESTQ